MIRDAPKTVRVEMVQWLRGEEKFASLDALVAQMQNDIAQAREILR
jgi:riboflavin kinase/FMN adenylyltransferase